MQWFKDKLLSRKFLAAVAAVAAAAFGIIQWSEAIQVLTAWIAVQGLSDAVTQLKK